MNIVCDIVQLELTLLRCGAQGTQRHLHGERLPLLRPEEGECLLLKRSGMAKTAEQCRTDGDEHRDRDNDHECVRHEQFCLEGQVAQPHGTPLFH